MPDGQSLVCLQSHPRDTVAEALPLRGPRAEATLEGESLVNAAALQADERKRTLWFSRLGFLSNYLSK